MCWSEEAKNVFERYSDYLLEAGKIDVLTLYEVKRTPSFFLKGSGSIKSDYNRLELNHIKTDDNEIVISYHFMQFLKTNPARKLERVFLGEDPIGFIRIENPPESLIIYNVKGSRLNY